ncbi:MAG TPA: hypothetical protein VGQ72_14885 [Pyrinomonadaceae bacterium]|nr:hypothetical protein [Pyrinomonadaceae bacterium]
MKRLCLLSLLLVFISASAAAQPTDARKPASVETAKAKSEKDLEAERVLRERRASAESILINLAADAARFNDQTLRARTQARIADVLWDADPEKARTLFRKAWDAAEAIDQENQRKLQEEIAQQKARNGGSAAVSGPPNIRGEVLRLAARRDRGLGEEFLAKMKTQTQQDATEAADKAKSNSFDAPEAVSQRLELARQLLNAGDVKTALQFADPVLVSINRDALDFLSYLREKDSDSADRRYAALLAVAAANLQSDANTVSLLASYLFTPHTFVTFDGNGSSVSSTSRNNGPPDVAPELRNAFFRVAADILLRPIAPPGQDQSSTGVRGKYMMLKRLLPLFEQFAPREMADAVRTQMEALSNAVSEDARKADDNTLREGIRPPLNPEEREKALLDRVDRAKTSAERDLLYLQLARLFTDSDETRARDYVEKIEDSELRQKVRAYIDATMVMSAVNKKTPDRVLELVRTGELTHLQKSWGLSQAAKLLSKTDRDKALAVLDDSATEARRLEGGDPDRPRALLAVANAMLTIDRGKAWDAVEEALKAANSAEGFTGEDGVLRVSLITKGTSSIRSSSQGEFDVAPIFNELANDDYERAIDLARGFQREAPRASATIAIAKSVLQEKKK